MNIFCSGIGGIGLSAYAAFRNAQGHTIAGSDCAKSALIEDLRSQGIAVTLNQDGSAVPGECDLFVYSEAIPNDAPERVRAQELGVPMQNYFQALGDLSRDKKVIAVCGTHGKSSTVAMAAHVLLDAQKDPSIIVGTKLRELDGKNWRCGDSDLFLLEACEYRRSFLALSPDIVLLLNADGDHFDAFASAEDYQRAFVEFLNLLPEDGIIITHLGDPGCEAIVRKLKREVRDIDGFPLPELATPGRHMQENAQLVLGLCELLAVPQEAAMQSLASYQGCWRRMEVRGVWGDGVTVIDDYAHHPRELSATIRAIAQEYDGHRLVCAFQPHMHDRTLKLYDGFVCCFQNAHLLVVSDVYDARSDVEKEHVDMQRFVDDIQKGSGIPVRYGGKLNATQKLLTMEILQPNDILLCLGAGDITKMAGRLVE